MKEDEKMSKDERKMKKDFHKKNIDDLMGNLNDIIKNVDDVSAFSVNEDVLPDTDISLIRYDYEAEIENIKEEARETIKCLSNLYLDDDTIKNKNINNIIKKDSEMLSELNFSISCSKRALIKAMEKIDAGNSNPDLYNAITSFQKEMRETIKFANELLYNKIKTFYKNLKEELEDINTGENLLKDEKENSEKENLTIIGDPKKLNALFDNWKNDNSLIGHG